MEKNQFFRLLGILFCILFLTFIIMFFFNINNKYSENENRYLQTFPNFSISDVLNGKYISKIEQYLSDHFAFRDQLVGLKSTVEQLLGKSKINNIYIASDDYLIEDYEKPENPDRIIEIFNEFFTKNNFVNNNLMLVPTSISINSNKLPHFASYDSQMETIDYIYKKIKMSTISVYETLLEHNETYPMYYRLDHHWTSYAAYYAYVEYCKYNNLPYLNIDEYSITEVTNNFNGTLYSKANIYNYKSDSIYLFLPKIPDDLKVEYILEDKITTTNTLYDYSYLETKDKYSIFLSNNHPLIKITNNLNKSDKKLLVIKDSYANSLIPFLTYNYKEIHVIDPRYYKDSITNYISENKITDSLFVYNMNTIGSDTGIYSIN